MRGLLVLALALTCLSGAATASSVQPSAASSDIARGVQAMQGGDPAGAITIFDAVLQRSDLKGEERFEALSNRGSAKLNASKPIDAIEDFDQALKLNPDAGIVYVLRGQAKLALYQYPEALTDLDMGVRLLPQSGFAHYQRGIAHYRLDQHDLARADFDEAVALKLSVGDLYVWRGELDLEAARFEPAMANADEAIRLGAAGEGHALRSRIVFGLKHDPAGAEREAGLAIAASPENSGFHVMRASARTTQGEYDLALEDTEAALALWPGSPEGLKAKGDAMLGAGRYADAVQAYLGALAANHTSPYVALKLHISRMRLHQEDRVEFAVASSRTKVTGWPAPIFAFLRGALSDEGLMQAARQGAEKDQKAQVCEANFYIAQTRLAGGDDAGARPGLSAAANACPFDFLERAAAAAELTRMGG